MKKFFAAAFHITLFQVLFVAGLSVAKYALKASGLSGYFRTPVIVMACVTFVVLLATLGFAGYIENQGYSLERWVSERPDARSRAWAGRLLHWGQTLPLLLGYGIALYLLLPDTIQLALAFFCGIVLRNCIQYVSSKRKLSS